MLLLALFLAPTRPQPLLLPARELGRSSAGAPSPGVRHHQVDQAGCTWSRTNRSVLTGPARAEACLEPLAELPGQAVSTQPVPQGQCWAGGWSAAPEPALQTELPERYKAKLMQPWPRVVKIKGSSGALWSQEEVSAFRRCHPEIAASIRSLLQAICLQPGGKSVAAWTSISQPCAL